MRCARSDRPWSRARLRGAAALAIGALTLPACQSVSMTLPSKFLQLETDRSQLKAMTPDDGMLWVREFADGDQGDLSFWVETLRNDLTSQRGYIVDDAGDVRDAAGRLGRRMTCSVNRDGEPYRYLIAVFVQRGTWTNTIRVVEFTARQPVFDANVADVLAAIPTLR